MGRGVVRDTYNFGTRLVEIMPFMDTPASVRDGVEVAGDITAIG
jgi:hypothetical protein